MKKCMYLNYDNTKTPSFCAQSIKNAGFSHAFIFWGKDNNNNILQVKACHKAGLEIETAHTTFENINSMWLKGSMGDEMTEYFIKSVKEAKDYGVPTLIVHVSSSYTPPPFGEVGLERFKLICEEADKNNIVIAFENLRRIEYLDYIMDNIDCNSKRFCFDCGHENIYNNGKGVLEKYSSLLTALHLHDNFGKEDDHILPFEGKINWETLAKRISRLKRSVIITLEVINCNNEPNFAAQAFERACRIENLIKSTRL